MRNIGIRLSIHSSPENVFHVLTDHSRYPEWNPWLAKVSGEFAEGKKLQVRPSLWIAPFSIEYEFQRVQAGSLLLRRQTGPLRFLFESERERALFSKVGGSTLYSTKLTMAGPFGGLVHTLFGRRIAKGIRDEAFALKQYCEQHFPLSGSEVTSMPADAETLETVDEPAPGFRRNEGFLLDQG